jgi:hypothetical protein
VVRVWNDSIDCLFGESRFGCPMIVCRPLFSARLGGCLVFLLRVKERALYLSKSSRTSTFRLARWGQLSSETWGPQGTELWRLCSQCRFKEVLHTCTPTIHSHPTLSFSSFRPRSGACHFPILRSAFVLCCDSNHTLSRKVYGRIQLFVFKGFLWRCPQGGWVVRSLRNLLVKPCSQNPCSASILLN